MNTVVLNGFGPHVRFTSKANGNASVKVVTRNAVKTVPLVKTTDLNFTKAA